MHGSETEGLRRVLVGDRRRSGTDRADNEIAIMYPLEVAFGRFASVVGYAEEGLL
jgi:hypothetical protein